MELSKTYITSETGKHIPFKEAKNDSYSMMFSSKNTHLGIEQSRRDDLESVFYLLIYFIKGSLPWQEIQSDYKSDNEDLVKQAKLDSSLASLCNELPSIYILI